jgi:hypothetical protein
MIIKWLWLDLGTEETTKAICQFSHVPTDIRTWQLPKIYSEPLELNRYCVRN